MDHAVFFFLVTFFAIAIQGLFALFEMAALSINRIRLQYFATLGQKRAIWLHRLLSRPSSFFGTTLIGINAALQIGSESSRKFYESIHLNPDWAPLTQVVLVVIFGELSPMFIARRHPSQIALALTPLMMLFARLFTPFIWMFDALSRVIHKFMGKSKEIPLFSSREEVAIAFREREEGEDELDQLTEQIFSLKNKNAGEVMTPFAKMVTAPSNASVAEIRHLLQSHYEPVIPLYHHQKTKIVKVVNVRDLMTLKEDESVSQKGKSPWFVTNDTSILELLNQFRRNKQGLAVILDLMGQVCGTLTLDQIVAEIFGEEKEKGEEVPSFYIERTLLGEMLVSDFNREFRAGLLAEEDASLSDLIVKELGSLPTIGEVIRIGPFLFTVIEPTLRGVKKLSVRSSG